ncbi:UNKNOWN [Stylonychia lemnae]|uniref:Uncharacterized protein n=1 Tax=Stylonychia lemnae TaxID=5949 RepID=A0A078AS53_STYLE|nr:UNKNOWN [Stylonychia lemnae]|eukprot:CDW85310.1 UNKNOWN [Stylonychia lemnae]
MGMLIIYLGLHLFKITNWLYYEIELGEQQYDKIKQMGRDKVDKRRDYLKSLNPAVCDVCAKKAFPKKKKTTNKRNRSESFLSYVSDTEDHPVEMIQHEQQTISLSMLKQLKSQSIRIEKQQDVPMDIQENDMKEYREVKSLTKQCKGRNKRSKTDAGDFIQNLDTTAAETDIQTTFTAQVPSDIKMNDDISAVKSLVTSKQKKIILSNALQFVNTSSDRIVILIITFLICTQLIDFINKLLNRVDALLHHQMIGLIASAFILRQSCLYSVKSALTMTTQENRQALILKLSLYLPTNYNSNTAKLLEQY